MAQKCHLWVQVYLHSNISNCLLISTQWCNVSSHHCFTLRQIKISSVLTSRILETGCGRVCVCVCVRQTAVCLCVPQLLHNPVYTRSKNNCSRRYDATLSLESRGLGGLGILGHIPFQNSVSFYDSLLFFSSSFVADIKRFMEYL